MPLKARTSARASSIVLPLTAADIIDAEHWLIEQPWPLDLDVGDDAVVDVEVDDDLVAAQRVEALGAVGRRHLGSGVSPPVPRVAVVVEDDLAVEVFEAGHRSGPSSGGEEARRRRRGRRPARRRRPRRCTRRSDARAVAPTPSTRISGLAQWWPARTHTFDWSSTWQMSWGWRSRKAKLDRAAPDLDVGRAVDGDVVAEALGQRADGVAGDVHLVGPHVGPCRAPSR